MTCSSPTDFLLQYQNIGAFTVISLMLFLSAGQFQSNLIRKLLYTQSILIVTIYITLLTPWGSKYYIHIYNKLTANAITKEQISLSSLNTINSTVKTKWNYLIVYFGYTFCPDVCPTTLNEITLLYKKHDGLISKVPFVFITLDPERDTQVRLTEYVNFFNPQISYLRLDPNQVYALSQDFGNRFSINQPDKNSNYSIDHSAELYLIDTNGRLLKTFQHPTKYENLKNELIIKGVINE